MCSERLRKHGIAIVKQVSGPVQKTGIDICEIARDLLYPPSVRLLGNTGHFNSASSKIDDEEYEVPDQPRAGEHFNAKEVGRRDRNPMRFEECLQRHALISRGRGIDTVAASLLDEAKNAAVRSSPW